MNAQLHMHVLRAAREANAAERVIDHRTAKGIVHAYTWSWATCWFADTGNFATPYEFGDRKLDAVSYMDRCLFGWWFDTGHDSSDQDCRVAMLRYLTHRLSVDGGVDVPGWPDMDFSREPVVEAISAAELMPVLRASVDRARAAQKISDVAQGGAEHDKRRQRMDPNATLARIQELVADIDAATRENDVNRALGLWSELKDNLSSGHESLSNGGSLPEVWQRGRTA